MQVVSPDLAGVCVLVLAASSIADVEHADDNVVRKRNYMSTDKILSKCDIKRSLARQGWHIVFSPEERTNLTPFISFDLQILRCPQLISLKSITNSFN